MSLGEGGDNNEGDKLLSINPGRGGGKQLSGRTLEKWLFECHIGHFLGKWGQISQFSILPVLSPVFFGAVLV